MVSVGKRLGWCVVLAAAWIGPVAGIDASDSSLLSQLLEAIRQVESRGGRDTRGDGGRSLGSYHISRAYWADGCRQLKREGVGNVPWDYDRWVHNDAQARRVIRGYWRRYAAPRYAPDSMADCEVLARVHNGGPTGHRKSSTAKYWRRVRRAMND